jgi:hypothetical protein
MRLGVRQRGLGFLAWISILAIASVAVTIGLRTIPHYLEYRAVLVVLESIEKKTLKSSPKREIRDLIDKRLRINSIRDFKAEDILEIERTKERTTLLLDYEVRENVVANVDIVIMFKNAISNQQPAIEN